MFKGLGSVRLRILFIKCDCKDIFNLQRNAVLLNFLLIKKILKIYHSFHKNMKYEVAVVFCTVAREFVCSFLGCSGWLLRCWVVVREFCDCKCFLGGC